MRPLAQIGRSIHTKFVVSATVPVSRARFLAPVRARARARAQRSGARLLSLLNPVQSETHTHAV